MLESCDKRTWNKRTYDLQYQKWATSRIPCKSKQTVWEFWNDCWRGKGQEESFTGPVIESVLGGSSPPDVGVLRVLLLSHCGIKDGTPCTLATTSWMGARSPSARFFFVCLMRPFRVLVLACVALLVGEEGWGWTIAQTVAEGTPVLLTLYPHTSANGLLHFLTTGQ